MKCNVINIVKQKLISNNVAKNLFEYHLKTAINPHLSIIRVSINKYRCNQKINYTSNYKTSSLNDCF